MEILIDKRVELVPGTRLTLVVEEPGKEPEEVWAWQAPNFKGSQKTVFQMESLSLEVTV